MNTSTPSNDKFVRLSRPAIPLVKLTAEHDASPVSTGEWECLSRPSVPLVRLRAEPIVPAATVRLALPLSAAGSGAQVFGRLHALIGKLNEIEDLGGRAGVWVDGVRSGVRDGEVVIVLAPNDPADAVETCKRIAHLLFNASPGVTVKVFVADAPETPVCELAV